MKRFSGSGLILAALLILGGLDLAIWPTSEVVHSTVGARSSRKTGLLFVGSTGERVLGVSAVVLGIFIGALAIYHEKK